MSMFDYDTRRITPQVVLVGTAHAACSSHGGGGCGGGSRNGIGPVFVGVRPDYRRRRSQAYGVASGVNNILVINHVTTPGRVTAILVNKTLGF
jgi:hypothetical protein